MSRGNDNIYDEETQKSIRIESVRQVSDQTIGKYTAANQKKLIDTLRFGDAELRFRNIHVYSQSLLELLEKT